MSTQILRPKPYASYFFGLQSPGQRMYAIPRYKYMYYANFNVNAQALSMYPALNLLGTRSGVSFKIKAIDRPNIDLQQRELNQYNRKRYAYVKSEYKPLNLTMYDTVDNQPFDLWVEYFTYYFGDARFKSSMTMQSNPVDPTFDDSTGWGLRPLAEQVNFFTSVDLYQIFGKEYSLTTYLNPKISAVDWGNNDSSDSGLEELKMTLTYETLQYDSGTITAELANQFGFDVSATLEPPGTQAATITPKSTGAGPHRYSNQANSAATAIVSDITKPSASVISNFGMNGTNYATLIGQTQYGPNVAQNGAPIQTQQVPGSQNQFATAVGANDTTFSGQGVGSQPSDVIVPENYGISGLPNGQLPVSNQFLPTAASNQDVFMSTKGGVMIGEGRFGSYNFGAGQVQSSGENYTVSTDPLTGDISYRPGVPDDNAFYTAQPVRYPGQFSYRPGVPDDNAFYTARPGIYLDQYGPNFINSTFNRYNSRNGRYLTQAQQIQAARRRVQQDGVAISIEVGQPEYTNYGIPTGYEQYPYQPGPNATVGPGLSLRVALSNNSFGITVATGNAVGFGGVQDNNYGNLNNFVPLDDPYAYGGDPSDNIPPPVVYPYDNSDY